MPDLISRIVLWRVKCRSKDFYRITAGRERTYQSESVNRIKGGARYNFNGRPLTRWSTISSLFLYSFFFPSSRFLHRASVSVPSSPSSPIGCSLRRYHAHVTFPGIPQLRSTLREILQSSTRSLERDFKICLWMDF